MKKLIDIRKLFQFAALLGLMLVTGVFYGNWISISRSYHLFSVDELAHIARVVVNNLATPMRFISIGCILLMSVSAYFTEDTKTYTFYFTIVSIALTVIAIVITIMIEVPINNQVVTWTASSVPADWQLIRDRWQFFNVVRVIVSLLSFVLFAMAILNPFRKEIEPEANQ